MHGLSYVHPYHITIIVGDLCALIPGTASLRVGTQNKSPHAMSLNEVPKIKLQAPDPPDSVLPQPSLTVLFDIIL